MSQTRWWRSVAAQVWFMVLTVVFLVGGLIYVNSVAETGHERTTVSEDLQQHVQATAANLSSSLRPDGDNVHSISTLLGQPAVATAGPACQGFLGGLGAAVPDGFLAVVDSSGLVLCSSSTAVPNGKRVFADVPLVRHAVRSGVGTSDGPYVDPATHALMMFTAVPLPQRHGASLIYGSTSQALLRGFVAPGSGKLTTLVVDTRTNTVVMFLPQSAPKGVVNVGRNLTGKPLGGSLNPGGAGVATVRGLDGQTGLYRAANVQGTPYRVIVGVSEKVAYAPVRASLQRNTEIGVGLMVAVAFMGLLLQRRVARPARALSAAIGALADDPDAPEAPTNGPSELVEVARAFNVTAEARRRADGLSRAILQHASDYLLVVDSTGRISFIGPSAERALGLEVGDDVLTMAERLHPGDRERVVANVREWMAGSTQDLEIEARIYDAGGVTRNVDARAQDLRHDRNVAGIVLTVHDITERKVFEDHLSHQARHDPLTGLANRAAVLERLSETLEDEEALPVCVFFIDLDRFKLVNDSHGHSIGDKVLVALSHKLREVVRPHDLVGRFGGDEFVVVTSSITGKRSADELAQRIRTTLEEPLLIGRRELFVSGSVGITMADYGDAPETVLRNADTAMYRAKARGRNCAAFFDDAMREDAKKLLRTESDLHRALERDQLVLHFQPVLSLGEDRITGVEALVRWDHPQHGLVPPGDFIPVAEETGLVVPIGAWVMREACTWAAKAGERLGIPLRVSVNISPRQLAQPDVVDQVDEALRASGLSPELLCLEVTESVFVQDAEVAARALDSLHDRGVRLSIDDFGTGWSSLTYLQQFPVDEIKLDRSYVSKVDQDKTSATIVAALVGMAHTMGLSVTAEGVETAEQARFLRATNCNSAQGFLFARPMPGAEVEKLLLAAAGRLPLPVPQPRRDVVGRDVVDSEGVA